MKADADSTLESIEVGAFPEDVATCHEMMAELIEALKKKDVMVEKLQHQLEQLLRHRFGRRSDRVDEDQLMLFIEELQSKEIEASIPAEDPEPPKDTKKRRKTRGRKPLPKDLPRDRVEHDVPEDQKTCSSCGAAKTMIREQISEQLEYVPASLRVTQHVQFVYACPSGCEGQVVMGEKPRQPIEKGIPGPGLLAQVAVNKYSDHLPLNRQEEIFKRHGVEIARSTQCDWMMWTGELVEPLYDLMISEVLQSIKIHTDDTPVKVQDKKLTRQGRLWVYVGDEEHPQIVYDYTASRKRDGPARFLRGYKGYLQADAYAGYDHIYAGRDITEVACWAHARRKFVEAESTDPETSIQAVARIKMMYEAERLAKEYLGSLPEDLPAQDRYSQFVEHRHALRQETTRQRVEDFGQWLRNLDVLPKSPMRQAVKYTLNQWNALTRFLENGCLEMDNNIAERALRMIAVGRTNWLFLGSNRGGKTAAILYSLISTCKRHEIDPFEYLRDLFRRISDYPMSQLADFLPNRWKDIRDQAALTQA